MIYKIVIALYFIFLSLVQDSISTPINKYALNDEEQLENLYEQRRERVVEESRNAQNIDHKLSSERAGVKQQIKNAPHVVDMIFPLYSEEFRVRFEEFQKIVGWVIRTADAGVRIMKDLGLIGCVGEHKRIGEQMAADKLKNRISKEE